MGNRGYFGIGIVYPKHSSNTGMLWRTARLYDAAFVFTVGERYHREAADTPNMTQHTPLFHFENLVTMKKSLPANSSLIGVELADEAVSLPKFHHPERAVYLLGAEDWGLSDDVLAACDGIVSIPSILPQSMNVAVAGSLVLYDRFTKLDSFVPMKVA